MWRHPEAISFTVEPRKVGRSALLKALRALHGFYNGRFWCYKSRGVLQGFYGLSIGVRLYTAVYA